MSNVPTVSVIVPVFNTPPDLLTSCLESVLSQSLDAIEIIVVDDCSTDGSRRIVDGYAGRGRMTVLHQEKNMGPAAARNRGLDHARGDFVGFVDSDDFVELSMFKRMSEVAITNDADVVACSVITHRPDGATGVTQYPLPSGIALREPALHTALATAHATKAYWYSVRFLFRRAFLEEHCIRFEPEIRLGEDTVFNAIALNSASAVYVLDESLYHVRQRQNSLTSTKGQPSQHLYINRQYEALRNFYSASGLLEERRVDHHKYILDFQLPQALGNIHHLSRTRNDVVQQLVRLSEMPWVYEALSSHDVTGTGAKRRLVTLLMRKGWFGALSWIYRPTKRPST